MNENQDLDRSEAATPHKLAEARKRGQVAKSADVVAAVVFTAAVTWLYAEGWDAARGFFALDRSLLAVAGRLDASPGLLVALASRALLGAAAALVPFFATLTIAAIVANIVQTGPVLSTHPVKPDLDRLNAMSGLRRILSGRTLFELVRACLKLAVLALVAYHGLSVLLAQFLQLSGMAASDYVRALLADTASLGLQMAAALCFIALLDAIYTRREFAQKMRMSRRDLRDEHKEREGDPRVRARMRELQREMRKRTASLSRTKDADVVITNPTHLAVALRYRHGETDAPLLVAKGAGALAALMRAIAARHGIPVVQNRRLARELFHRVDVERHVPARLYAEVARIIVWVFAMRQAREARP
jgi:flagellar biosynthetic protein FlhB